MANKIQTAVAKAAENKAPVTIKDYIIAQKAGIAAALPAVMTPERFTRITLSAVSKTPRLGECTPPSFLAAMMTAAQLGLEPNTPLGQAYLIPRRIHGVLNCQFEIGYKGLIDLAYRSGEVKIIQAHTVRENDEFEYELGLEPKLRHVPASKDRGAPTHYYGMFQTKNGGFGFAVMSVEEAMEFGRKNSESFDKGPWKTHFDEMAKKTCLKKALKYAPMKSEFLRALAQDETVKNEIDADMADIPNIIEADGEEVPTDPATGEVIEEGQQEMKEVNGNA